MIFTHSNRITAKFVALLAVFSMILSAFPASFFIAEAATGVTLFSDGFETTPGFPNWDTSTLAWINTPIGAHGGTRKARVLGPNIVAPGSLLSKAVATEDYENINLSFWYKYDDLEVGDILTVEWYDGSSWAEITNFEGATGSGDDVTTWTQWTGILPSGAEDNANFELRFRSNFDALNDRFLLDDVNLTGDDVVVACSPQFDVIGPTPIQNTDTSEYFDTIQDAIDDCDTVDGQTIDVASGTHTEDIDVNKEVTLEGNSVSIVEGQTKILASNVTLNGFIFDGAATSEVVLMRIPGTANDVSNVTITNNIFQNIDVTSDNDSAALTIESSDGTLVEGNTFKDLTTANSGTNDTMQGILVGDTGQSEDIEDVTIKDNLFTNISGGRGGYGILVNRTVSGLVIVGNTIEKITGNADSTGSGWASGIGLDADTPSALIKNNIISEIDSLINGFYGGFGIIGQSTAAAESITVEYNDFLVDKAAENRTDGEVDFSLNWWGDMSGPSVFDTSTVSTTKNADGLGGVAYQTVSGGDIEIEPWLCGSFTTDPEESVAGECDTTKPTVNIDSPAHAEIVGTDVDVMGTASDAGSGIEKVLYTVTQIAGIGCSGCFLGNIDSGTASGTEAWDFSLAGLATGFYRLKVQAFDFAGNWKYDFNDVEVDADKPNVTIETPDHGEVFGPGTVHATGTATDGQTSIVEVKYTVTEIDAIGGTYVANVASGVATGTAEWDFMVELLTPGFYRLKVQAFDEDGNWRYKYHDIQVVEAPASLEITNPATDGETLSGVHTFEAEYTDDDETVDIIHWALKTGGTCEANNTSVNVAGFGTPGYAPASYNPTTGEIEVTVDMSTWDDGEYCLVVNPKETGGETDTERETRTFFLDNPEPIACVPGVNILANASFEEPVIESSWALVDPIAWVSQKLSGGAETVMEIQRGVFGWSSSDGEQHAELATSEATRLSQTVETIPGKEYTLSWDYSARPGTDKPESKMVVRVNGSKVETNNRTGQSTVNWRPKDYVFIADSTETTVSFEDKGDNDGLGALLDNTSLTCDTPPEEPEPEVGPYCGDGILNQPWEQCDLGYTGNESGYDESGMCNATCQYDNQCVEVNLVKITLQDTESVSFDDTVYLGSALNELPNGVWFNFDEIGDDAAHTIANNSDGLGVERDTDTNELKLAFVGGNGQKKLDQALGSIELFGFEAGSINRQLNPQFKLENGSGGSFDDYFFKSSPTTVDFDLRADTGNDGVILGLEDVDICELDIIDGHKWNDENGNGYWDEGEEAIEGWTIYLESLNESEEYEDASAVTDENGYYYFMVDGGNWEVIEEERDGWVQTAPYGYGSCEFYLNGEVKKAKLLSIETEGWEHEYENENHCDFGNHYYYQTIEGSKWNDEDGDGVWDEGELAMSGWTIELVDDEDEVASTTVTDGNGYYSFNGVAEGVWTVREVQQEGWIQTAPTVGSCEFEFEGPVSEVFTFFNDSEPEEEIENICDFGNQQIQALSRSGGGSRISLSETSSSQPEGQVLGASTSQCGMYLYDYMKQGQENKVFEVQKLQLFLLKQKYYGVGLSGVFDSATDAAVRAFQAAHSTEILKPWVDLGLATAETPTGYVYKTTRWKINDLVCPGDETYPTLP